jgi:hypothetical protein
VITDLQLAAVLDVHDCLVKSCIDSSLPLQEFLALYNNFPHAYALDGHQATPAELEILRQSNRRIAFHFQVAKLLSGLLAADVANSLYQETSRIAPAVGLMQLRDLVEKHPDFKAGREILI